MSYSGLSRGLPILLVFFVCLGTVTVAAGQNHAKKALHCSGRILDGATGAPLEAARIRLVPSERKCVWRTDSLGRFSFWALIESNQRITIENDGYRRVSLISKNGALHDIRLSLSRDPVQLPVSGTVMPPSQAVAPAILSADSGPKLSGTAHNWSRWYRLGIVKAPGGYTLQGVEFWLSGDRSCGAGAECRQILKNNRQVVWEFRLQGHSESGAPLRTYSLAHIRVLYRPE